MARDASFFERDFMQLLGNWRIIPDSVIILLGVVPLAWFLFSTFRKLKPVEIKEGEDIWKRLGIDQH